MAVIMTNEEAIKELQESHDMMRSYAIDESKSRLMTALKMAIKALEQEPKTGHWILDETDNSITCDKCGCLIWANDIHNGEAYYCPNCGAKMESEVSE